MTVFVSLNLDEHVTTKKKKIVFHFCALFLYLNLKVIIHYLFDKSY